VRQGRALQHGSARTALPQSAGVSSAWARPILESWSPGVTRCLVTVVVLRVGERTHPVINMQNGQIWLQVLVIEQAGLPRTGVGTLSMAAAVDAAGGPSLAAVPVDGPSVTACAVRRRGSCNGGTRCAVSTYSASSTPGSWRFVGRLPVSPRRPPRARAETVAIDARMWREERCSWTVFGLAWAPGGRGARRESANCR
jgi:hypothetical protein